MRLVIFIHLILSYRSGMLELTFYSLLNCVKRILAANNIEEPLQNYEHPLQPLSVKLLCSTTKGCRDIYNLLP